MCRTEEASTPTSTGPELPPVSCNDSTSFTVCKQPTLQSGSVSQAEFTRRFPPKSDGICARGVMFQFVWSQIRIQQAPPVIFIKQTQEAKGDQNQEPVQTGRVKGG